MRRAGLLVLGLSALLAGQEAAAPAAPRRIEVPVQPPDMVFRFAPRVTIPGMPRVALALSGGGARGLAHIGVLQRFEEVGYPLDSLTGTSAGALVAALYASGFSGREIEDLFRRLDLTRAFLEPLLRAPGETLGEQEGRSATFLSVERGKGQVSLAQGLRSGVEVQRTLQGLLARGAYFSGGDFDQLQLPLRVLATNLETGRGRVFGQGDLVEAVRASMAIPGGFRPVLIEGQQYVDGALVENLPVSTAKEAFHPDLVIAVDVSAPLEQRPSTSILSVAARSLDLVVERRQWESRAAADFLIRPEIRDVPFLEYGSQAPRLVLQGREGFEARRAELDALLKARLPGREDLGVARVAWDCPGGPPPAAAALARAILRLGPEGAPAGRVQVLDVQILLQQILVHGHAREAWATVEGEGCLVLHLRPYGPVTGVDLEVPPAWESQARRILEEELRLGEPYDPHRFGHLVSNLVYQLLMDGSPLVDARGSGLDAATGRARLVLREPLVSRVEVWPVPGRPVAEDQVRRIVGPLDGRAFRPEDLQKRLALVEHRLHLSELHYLIRPDGQGGTVLSLIPVPQERDRLDLSLGYESTLGGELGLAYRALDLALPGSEVELSAARNRLQQQASLALRRPFGFSPGTGIELSAQYWQQRLETPLLWPAPELPEGGLDARIGASDLVLRTYFRFSNLGTGRVNLDLARRHTAFRQGEARRTQAQDVATLSGEWDNFDRHTLPREGLLLRARLGRGRTQAGSLPGADFQQGYFRARGLHAFSGTFGADLDLEWGGGRRLPLDRWWVLGGSSFVLGSQASGLVAPAFAAARVGLPFRLYAGLGLTLEVAPRYDRAVLSRETSELFRVEGPVHLQGSGLVLRTTLSNFYVELSYGFLRTWSPQGVHPAAGAFTVLVGTQPFDLWKRR